jgi:large subunit ribosomal protein L25
MSNDFELKIVDRENHGTADSRRSRSKGFIPAVLYGAKRDPRHLLIDSNKFRHFMEKDSFYTSIITLTEEKGPQSVIIKSIQRHPSKQFPTHIDFLRVRDDVAITLNVPLSYIGDDVATGVKTQGGEFSKLVTEIEISCLPKDLPEAIEVDVSAMELNQVLHLSEITLPEGVTSLALAAEQDPGIATIQLPKRQEIEEEVIEETDAEGGDIAEASTEEASAEPATENSEE